MDICFWLFSYWATDSQFRSEDHHPSLPWMRLELHRVDPTVKWSHAQACIWSASMLSRTWIGWAGRRPNVMGAYYSWDQFWTYAPCKLVKVAVVNPSKTGLEFFENCLDLLRQIALPLEMAQKFHFGICVHPWIHFNDWVSQSIRFRSKFLNENPVCSSCGTTES